MKKENNEKKPLRSVKQTPANPEKFGQDTSPVRARMEKEMRTMSPDERIKRGR